MTGDVLHTKRELTEALSRYYDTVEAEALARRLLEEVSGLSYPEMILSGYKITEKEATRLADYSRRLLQHEPIQQVLGYEEFGSLRLRVTPHTLIPRPETEELCEKIVARGWAESAHTAIDIGTGTGAIVLYLKSKSPQTTWYAIDVDPETLSVARENARRSKKEVSFHLRDLSGYNLSIPLDLIVSNPPYILPQESEEMAPHVLEHEPHRALFAPGDDPIYFYRLIVEKVVPDLTPAGHIALELNPLTAHEVSRLFEDYGFVVELEDDFRGKKRFLFAHQETNEYD